MHRRTLFRLLVLSRQCHLALGILGNARAGYRDMEKEEYHKGELYISRMIDEEMKADDLRIR